MNPVHAAAPPDAGRALFEVLFARGPFAVVVVGPDVRIERANAGFAQMLGYPSGELEGRSVLDVTHPDDLASDREFFGRLDSHDGGFRFGLKRFLHAEGHVVWADATALVIRNPGGGSKAIAFATDVTARRQMEEALRRSNERFESVARASQDLVYEWDILAGVITWNAVMQSRYGHPDSPETRSLDWWTEQLHPQDRERVTHQLTAALGGTEEQWSAEYRFRDANGAWREIFDRALFLRDAGGYATRMIGVMTDVTELRAAQAQMRMADRLVSLGTLAAGVAHEINNPLSWVLSNVAVARDAIGRQAVNEPVDEAFLKLMSEALEDVEDGARRVAGIVRDLKMFARPDEERRAPVPLDRVLEAALSVARNDLRHRARVVRDYAAVPPVLGNEARLAQVFLNLVVNATQALPDRPPNQNEIRLTLRRAEDGRVEAAVSDTGGGIADDVLQHLFDPFFTTKPSGVGSGLGLAICHRIVTALGGEIRVDTVLGEGSTFRVLLPACPEEGAPRPARPAPPERSPHARVLVLDDEPVVGRALQRALEHHHVQLATSPSEVLARAAAGERWDLILCDVMMPQMSGMEFFAALREVAPGLCDRVAFMTGGAFTPRAQDFFAGLKNPALEKPFDASAVEAVLAAVRGAAPRPS